MDFDLATETVHNRVEKVEPELANKIIGYLLLRDNIDREMIRLAFGPDCVIDSAVKEAKSAMGFGSSMISPISPAAKPTPEFPLDLFPLMIHHPISPSPGLHVSPPPYWDSLIGTDNHFPSQQRGVMISQPNPDIAEKHRLVNRFLTEENSDLRMPELLEFPEDNTSNQDFNNLDYTFFSLPVEDFSLRIGRRTTSFADSLVKACHYYYNGYCKHGASCRYYHGQSVSDSFSKPWKSNHNDIPGEDSVFSSGSLERLESEIVELLKSQGGQCVSISMLPVLYSERYGKSLQAEGYLTESQRHGKIGFSLTKLLARLRNSIQIIDRPHGQHSVVLVGDTGRNLENRCQTSDHGNAVTSSQQIYLTFPAESTFMEEDVSNYFNRFGTVHAVRIPPQQKRMFGFVTFVLPETVKIVLSKGNPHLICGARVLAKPYREKARNYERRYSETIDIPASQSSHHLDFQNRFNSVPRALENTARRQLWVEHELEQQLKRFNSLQLASRQYLGNNLYDMQGAGRLEDGGENLSVDCPVPQLGTRNCNAVMEDISRGGTFSNFSRQESSHLDLPESAFASSSVGSRIQQMYLS